MGERFLDTEEATGSIPVSPTEANQYGPRSDAGPVLVYVVSDARRVPRVQVRGRRAVRRAVIPVLHAGCTDGPQRLSRVSIWARILGEQRAHDAVITA